MLNPSQVHRNLPADSCALPVLGPRFLAYFLLLAMAMLLACGPIAQAQKIAQPKLPDGFESELIYTVPKAQGSWVSITTDPKGRLISSDQYGKLYRTTIADGKANVEAIELKIGRAQGLLCAFDSLYVVAHAGGGQPAGLFRVTDKDNDDQYDKVEMLREFKGGGEHGPHAVILSPDKKSLYLCAGNHTQLPNPETSRVPRVWQEDQVLPRLPDANGHATGRLAPGGWICKTDPDGKQFELISSGYRNEYDIAFDPNGELFTFDADMEWDVGLPWYRPTRVCHAVSGSEFGWRYGTGKWPAYYPDSLPSLVDIGPGSPTGIVFGTGSKFPAKYQNSLFISDWSYGIIYSVTIQAEGASYRGTAEVFCTAPALPVTDLIINPIDGALYFLIGGRRSKSALYRVTYSGSESTAPTTYPPLNKLAALRREIEAGHISGDSSDVSSAVTKGWSYLNHKDRFIRFAARTTLEHHEQNDRLTNQPIQDPQIALEAALAVVRTSEPSPLAQEAVLKMLNLADWSRLDETQQLQYLRVAGLVLARLGEPTKGTITQLRTLSEYYPSKSVLLNRELSRVLAMVNSQGFVDATLELLKSAGSQHEQIHYALALSSATKGWSAQARTEYFEWFLQAAKLQGGNSFGGYLKNIRQQAVDQMSDAEREEFKTLLAKRAEVADPYADLKAKPFVKKWTLEDLLPIKDDELENRDLKNGKELFAVASCYKCHRLAGLGGIVGPDLTPAGHRFSNEDLLETMISPDKEVSDQYRATIFQMDSGKTVVGRVVNLNGNSYMVQTDMIRPNSMQRLKVNEIDGMKPSTTSMMPAGLLDNMTRDDILDLMGYLKSFKK